MMNKQFDKLRMITQMNEMVHIIKTNPYKTAQDSASANLAAIQEAYKSQFGEYSSAHIMENAQNPKWEINSAKRQDGYVFNVDDEYADANGKTHTIKRMYIGADDRVMMDTKDGRTFDLWLVVVDKFIGTK